MSISEGVCLRLSLGICRWEPHRDSITDPAEPGACARQAAAAGGGRRGRTCFHSLPQGSGLVRSGKMSRQHLLKRAWVHPTISNSTAKTVPQRNAHVCLLKPHTGVFLADYFEQPSLKQRKCSPTVQCVTKHGIFIKGLAQITPPCNSKTFYRKITSVSFCNISGSHSSTPCGIIWREVNI